MSDPYRTDGSHALDAGSTEDRDAKIEQLLLGGLDYYFASQYEQAINVWTRALFLDRNHARARAYIERARSALAERQRRSEELLQDGVAAFERGDGGEARRLLRAAIDGGAPADEAFTVLDRLDRLDQLERADAAVPVARTESAKRVPTTRPAVPESDAVAAPHRGRAAIILAAGILIVLAAIGGALATGWNGWRWVSLLALEPAGAPSAADSSVQTLALPVPRRAEMVLARARSLAAGGRLHDALAALDRIRLTDAERGEADRLRVQIQHELLALASRPEPPPAGAGDTSAP